MLVPSPNLTVLKDLAISLGASDASIINSSDIVINAELAKLCKNSEGGCKNYGMSLSCPPNVEGPSGFKRWQKNSNYTVAIKIDVPRVILFSNERLEVMKLLHEIVANVEQKATKMGYYKSRSFAGGSCKEIFCHDYLECSVLVGVECRNQTAKPSMSGFGIDVHKLLDTAGWSDVRNRYNKPKQEITWIAGIVLIAK